MISNPGLYRKCMHRLLVGWIKSISAPTVPSVDFHRVPDCDKVSKINITGHGLTRVLFNILGCGELRSLNVWVESSSVKVAISVTLEQRRAHLTQTERRSVKSANIFLSSPGNYSIFFKIMMMDF